MMSVLSEAQNPKYRLCHGTCCIAIGQRPSYSIDFPDNMSPTDQSQMYPTKSRYDGLYTCKIQHSIGHRTHSRQEMIKENAQSVSAERYGDAKMLPRCNTHFSMPDGGDKQEEYIIFSHLH